MIIDSAMIGMESERTYKSVSREASYTCITATAGYIPNFTEMIMDPELTAVTEKAQAPADETPEKTEDIKDIFENLKTRQSQRAGQLIEQNMLSKLRQETLKYLFRLIWGDGKYPGCAEENRLTAVSAASPGGSDFSYEDVFAGGQLYMTKGSVHISYESEQTVFSTTGTVCTADGRNIDINVEAVMSREFIEYTGVKIAESVALKDPLVINLDGNPASVSDQKFYFDIDSDGIEDLIPQLSEGKGLLALDRDDDGLIGSGSELFGALSGDGFADLAEFDVDGNGWIDEADDVFAKLKICVPDSDGSLKQLNLAEAGIGAMFLGSSGTDFTLKNLNTNATEAVIRRTGLFLYESGAAGTYQQVDLGVS